MFHILCSRIEAVLALFFGFCLIPAIVDTQTSENYVNEQWTMNQTSLGLIPVICISLLLFFYFWNPPEKEVEEIRLNIVDLDTRFVIFPVRKFISEQCVVL